MLLLIMGGNAAALGARVGCAAWRSVVTSALVVRRPRALERTPVAALGRICVCTAAV
jgi:hypothetical protein